MGQEDELYYMGFWSFGRGLCSLFQYILNELILETRQLLEIKESRVIAGVHKA